MTEPKSSWSFVGIPPEARMAAEEAADAAGMDLDTWLAQLIKYTSAIEMGEGEEPPVAPSGIPQEQHADLVSSENVTATSVGSADSDTHDPVPAHQEQPAEPPAEPATASSAAEIAASVVPMVDRARSERQVDPATPATVSAPAQSPFAAKPPKPAPANLAPGAHILPLGSIRAGALSAVNDINEAEIQAVVDALQVGKPLACFTVRQGNKDKLRIYRAAALIG